MQVSSYYEDLIKTTTSEIDKKEQFIKTSELLIFMNELKIKDAKKKNVLHHRANKPTLDAQKCLARYESYEKYMNMLSKNKN